MINHLKRTSILLMLVVSSCSVMLLYTRPAAAAVECYFYTPGAVVNIGSVTSQGTVTLKPGGGWLTSELDTGESRTTDCNTGRSGQNLYSWRSSLASESSISVAGTVNGSGSAPQYQAALFATNVPGIYYTVEIMKGNKTTPSGYIADNTTASTVAVIGDDADRETLDGGVTHHFYIRLYQDPSYISNSASVSAITPLNTGEIGYFRYGSKDAPAKIIVNNFSIPIQVPGCNAALSSQNASGSTVNMGTTTPEDIQSGATKPVPFSISLTGCANADQAVVKLTSEQYDSSTGYLKNTGADMGVGVKITGADSGIQLKPGGSSTTWSVSGTSATLAMNAQLMKLSDTLSTGKFSAQGTFEITYN